MSILSGMGLGVYELIPDYRDRCPLCSGADCAVRHGLYFSSREGKFLECNQAMVDMLGYSNKEEALAIDLARDLYLEASD